MRVAIVHYTSPPVAGGVEQVVRGQALTLRRHGHHVLVVSGRGQPFSGVTFRRIPLLAGTHVTQRAISRELARGSVSDRLEEVAETIEQDLREALSGYDAVLAHNILTLHFNVPLTIAVANLARTSFRNGIAAWTHDVAAINPIYESDLHRGWPWDLYRGAQPGVRYVTISETRRRELQDMWARTHGRQAEVEVIPNGVDPLEIWGIPLAMQKALGPNALSRYPVLLAPVRITRRKRLELAISAVADLANRGYDPTLIVTGPLWGHHPARSRAYLAELDALSQSLGVEDRVHFLARSLNRPLTRKEMSALYSAADVQLLPSESEGFGLPLLEAALYRLPVVASELTVFRELGRGDVTLFPIDASAKKVAGAVERVLGARGFRWRVMTEYSWDALYTHRLEPLLSSLGHA